MRFKVLEDRFRVKEMFESIARKVEREEDGYKYYI